MHAFHLTEYIDTIDRLPCRSLFGADPSATTAAKAGVLPFVREGGQRIYLLMRPLARKPEAGPPPFQIAKGSRLAYLGGRWLDSKEDSDILLRSDATESILITALREGVEELGLNLAHARMVHLGREFPFISASTGVTKQVWVNAVEMNGRDCLHGEELADTAEIRWMTPEEAGPLCRPDHWPIVKAIDTALEASISR